MKGSSEALLDNTDVPFCFWDMLLGIGIVDTNTKLVGEWVHEGLKLVVTVDGLDGESSTVVDTEHCLQSTPVRFACLIGKGLYSSVHDVP